MFGVLWILSHRFLDDCFMAEDELRREEHKMLMLWCFYMKRWEAISRCVVSRNHRNCFGHEAKNWSRCKQGSPFGKLWLRPWARILKKIQSVFTPLDLWPPERKNYRFSSNNQVITVSFIRKHHGKDSDSVPGVNIIWFWFPIPVWVSRFSLHLLLCHKT